MKKGLFLLFSLVANLTFGQIPDNGIGVAFLQQSLPTNESPKWDTMKIFRDKNLNSKIASFIFNPHDRFDNRILTLNKVSSKSLLQFDYETYGLPITQIDSNQRVIEVIYGYNNNIPLKGWVNLKESSNKFYLWKSYLKERYLFFINDRDINFYDKPNGEKIQISLSLSQEKTYDYILKPIDTIGDWMKVTLVTPDDYGRDIKNKKELQCWIKFISQNGRPMVWFYARD